MFALRPDQIMQEVVEFNQKLAKGLSTLSQVGEVETGVSPREAVY